MPFLTQPSYLSWLWTGTCVGFSVVLNQLVTTSTVKPGSSDSVLVPSVNDSILNITLCFFIVAIKRPDHVQTDCVWILEWRKAQSR